MSLSNGPKVSSAELLKAHLVIAEAKKDALAAKGKGQKSKGLSADENTPPGDVKPVPKLRAILLIVPLSCA
jgi:hypothetical protein